MFMLAISHLLLFLALICVRSSFAAETAPALIPGQFPPNSIWVKDSFNSLVRGFTFSGESLSLTFASSGPGIEFGPNGQLYVTNTIGVGGGLEGVVAVDYTGGTTHFGTEHLETPYGMVFGPAGHLYVADLLADAIVEFDGNNNFVRSITASGLTKPIAIAAGPDGHLFVSTLDTGKILEVDPELGVVDSTDLSNVVDLTLDNTGRLWATRSNDGIYVLGTNDFTVLSHKMGAPWTSATATEMGPDSNVWFAFGSYAGVTDNDLPLDRTLFENAGIGGTGGIAFAPSRVRAKITLKPHAFTWGGTSQESIDLWVTPGSSRVSMSFVGSNSKFAQAAGYDRMTFVGFGGSAQKQYRFTGIHSVVPMRTGGFDTLAVVFSGTTGPFGEFRPTKATGAFQMSHPFFLLEGKFK